jgi:hypothetical protein
VIASLLASSRANNATLGPSLLNERLDSFTLLPHHFSGLAAERRLNPPQGMVPQPAAAAGVPGGLLSRIDPMFVKQLLGLNSASQGLGMRTQQSIYRDLSMAVRPAPQNQIGPLAAAIMAMQQHGGGYATAPATSMTARLPRNPFLNVSSAQLLEANARLTQQAVAFNAAARQNPLSLSAAGLLAQQHADQQAPKEHCTTGRRPIMLHNTEDDTSLSEYQCLVRKQIEVFEAVVEDVDTGAQGRNRPIVLGQVGIRCRHCASLAPKKRRRGAVYYPARLDRVYQAAQNMAKAHLASQCQNVSDDIRQELVKLSEHRSSVGGGKKYWADAISAVGVYEDDDGLRFANSGPKTHI